MNGGWSGTAAEQAAQDIIDLRNAGYLADGAPDDLKDTIKSMCVELFEGKYATGADFCKALDALY